MLRNPRTYAVARYWKYLWCNSTSNHRFRPWRREAMGRSSYPSDRTRTFYLTSLEILVTDTLLERPSRSLLLHSYSPSQTTDIIGPHNPTNRGNSVASSHIRKYLGSHRPTRRHCQLCPETKRRGGYEWLEFRYEQAIGTGREVLDGHECGFGGASTRKGLILVNTITNIYFLLSLVTCNFLQSPIQK